jgi:hypothetical protein
MSLLLKKGKQHGEEDPLLACIRAVDSELADKIIEKNNTEQQNKIVKRAVERGKKGIVVRRSKSPLPRGQFGLTF